MGPCEKIELSRDTAVVATLAGTAVSFAHSAEGEAERWLRALRLNGRVGEALQALGVGEAPLARGAEAAGDRPRESPPLGADGVDRVIRRACAHASEQRSSVVCTADLLFALLEIYGETMDRALRARGASSLELLQLLDAKESPVEV